MNRSYCLGVAALVCAGQAWADLKVKASYTNAGQTANYTVYISANRQRFEYEGGMTLIRQSDTKRLVEIDDQAKSYILTPLERPPEPVRKGGTVNVTITVVDTGETREAFGLTARHLKTTAITNAASGACEPGQEKLETDGWYINVPYPETASGDTQPVTCKDEVHVESTGPKPGYPIAYVSTVSRGKADPSTMSMNVTDLSTADLPAALFDPPPDYTERKTMGAILAARPKLDGAVRVGVVPFNDASGRQLDVSPFHTRLAGMLTGNALQGVPIGAPTEADAAHCDFILQTEVAAITKSAVGQVATHVVKVGSLLGRGGRGGGANSGTQQDGTMATLNFRLVRVGSSEEALASSAAGKNGSALNIRTAIQIAMMVSPMGMMMHTMGGQGFMMIASHFMSGAGPGMGGGGGDPALSILFSLLQQPSSAAGSPELAAVSAALDNEAAAVKTKLQNR